MPNTSAEMRDWYEVLGIDPRAPDDQITAAIERLSRQASALANAAPERSQRLRDTVRLIRRDLQGTPDSRRGYDERLGRTKGQGTSGPQPAATMPQQPGSAAGQTPSAVPGWAAPGSWATGSAPVPSITEAVKANLGPLAARVKKFMQTAWTCSQCGAEGSPASAFCARCGARMQSATPQVASRLPQTTFCGTCGTVVGPSDVFCSSCGKPVSNG